MATVAFQELTKEFDGVLAVNQLTLEVEDGEFLVLVGPSGCGKSTALRCLAGLEDVSRGTILIGDRDVTWAAPKDRDIAMVFQNYALYPHMNVAENLAFGLKMRRMTKAQIEDRVERVSSILDINELLDRRPGQLSGGQRQRVALGRAIVREPQVFLMDEPLSNLDAKLRVQTRAEITKLQHRLGTTTIYVTHDQVEAMTMGHRIAVMNHGVLQQLDTPQNIFDHPANLFVAAFIGSPAMNIFPAEIEAQGERFHLVGDGISLTIPRERKLTRADAVGRDVLVGIRPEYLSLGMNGTGDEGNVLRLPVELVETLGSEQLIHMRGPDSSNLIARIESQSHLRSGEIAELAVDMSRLHVFDRETETALL